MQFVHSFSATCVGDRMKIKRPHAYTSASLSRRSGRYMAEASGVHEISKNETCLSKRHMSSMCTRSRRVWRKHTTVQYGSMLFSNRPSMYKKSASSKFEYDALSTPMSVVNKNGERHVNYKWMGVLGFFIPAVTVRSYNSLRSAMTRSIL